MFSKRRRRRCGSRYELAWWSSTEPFVAVALLQLIEAGHADLDPETQAALMPGAGGISRAGQVVRFYRALLDEGEDRVVLAHDIGGEMQRVENPTDQEDSKPGRPQPAHFRSLLRKLPARDAFLASGGHILGHDLGREGHSEWMLSCDLIRDPMKGRGGRRELGVVDWRPALW